MPIYEPSIASISAGTTNATGRQVVLSNSNGVSFGVSGNTITASINAAGNFGGIAAGTQTATSGTILFQNSNNVTFGMSNSSVVTASVPAPTALGVSGGLGDTGSTQGTIFFIGAGNVTLSQITAAGSQATIIINATLPVTSNNGVFVAAGTQTATNGTVLFQNSNGVSFGMSNSTVVTAAFDGIKSISAGTTLVSNGQVVFSNSNNISFGLNGNTLTASINQTVQPAIGALGVSTLGNTLGNTGTTIGTVVFAGIGNVTLSQSTAVGSNATISISVAPTPSIAISAGTTLASSGTIVFSNSNGVSFGLDGNTVTASVQSAIPAQSITVFSQWAEFDTNYTVSTGLISYQKVSLPMAISASYGMMILDLLGPSNSFGGVTVNVAAYSLSGQTAQTIATHAGVFSWTSGAATTATSVYGGASGTRYRSFNWPVVMSAGDYLFAFVVSTTNNVTCRVFGRQGVNLVGSFAGPEMNYFFDGYSNALATNFPDTVIATDPNYARTGLSAMQQPGFILVGST